MSRDSDRAPYARVERRQWTDPEFRRLDKTAKLTLLYLQSCSHGGMLGAYQLSLATAADDLNLPLSEVEATIHGPLANFLTYDRDCREIFIPGQGRIQVCAELCEGDRRRIGAQRELEALNSATIRRLVLGEYGIAWDLRDVEGPSKGAPREPRGSPEAIAVAVAIPEQSHNSAVAGAPAKANGAVLNIDDERQRRADRRGADGGSTPDSDVPEPYPGFNDKADAATQAIGGLDNPAWRKWIRSGGEDHLALALGLRLVIDAGETGWKPGEIIRSPTVFDRSAPGLRGQAESAYYRSRDKGSQRAGTPGLVDTRCVGVGPDQAVDSTAG